MRSAIEISRQARLLPIEKVAAKLGIVVVYSGDIMTMPGSPKVPAAKAMGVDANGNTVGLF